MKNIRTDRTILALVIITTAVCLRAPITSVGSVLYCIIDDLELSSTIAGAITTIPLVVMAVLSPFISKISHRYGVLQSLLIGLFLLILGIGLRSFGGRVGLLTGTTIIGAGITFGNVLIPAIIKLFFPDKIGNMTGIFTTTMSVCSGVGAGISAPLAVGLGLGWRATFCLWIGAALVAGMVTILQIHRMQRDEIQTSQPLENCIQPSAVQMNQIYKQPVAWCVAMMFGGQSCVFYMLVTWLPTIAVEKGITPMAAGGIAMILQISAIPANFMVPLLAEKFKDQRSLSVLVSCFSLVGLLGLCFSNSIEAISISTSLVALGLGGTFSLSLVIFGLRTSNASQAAQLSGFAQSAGYVMAAVTPALSGALYDWFGGWSLPLGILVGIMFIELLAGIVAGADRQI